MRILLLISSIFTVLTSTTAEAKPLKGPNWSRLGVSVFSGFPVVAGGGFEYRFLSGVFTDVGLAIGIEL